MNGDRRAASRVNRRAMLVQGVAALAAFVLFHSRRGSNGESAHQKPDRAKLDELVARFGAVAAPTTMASSTAATITPAAPIIFIDPGHGGVDEGAVGTTSDGQTVLEKTVTLAIAQKTQARLESAGFPVALSRTADTLPGVTASDLAPDGESLTPAGVLNDLQRRIDRANASGARLFLSIHLNATDDPSVRGTETYVDSARSFAHDNQRFAELVQTAVIAALHQHGYNTPDRGVVDDTQLKVDSFGTLPASYDHLVLLGPEVSGQLRPTQMPGALNEALFLTIAEEASAAADPTVQDLIASGYARAVEQFFASTP